jgi:hypothetical protein
MKADPGYVVERSSAFTTMHCICSVASATAWEASSRAKSCCPEETADENISNSLSAAEVRAECVIFITGHEVNLFAQRRAFRKSRPARLYGRSCDNRRPCSQGHSEKGFRVVSRQSVSSSSGKARDRLEPTPVLDLVACSLRSEAVSRVYGETHKVRSSASILRTGSVVSRLADPPAAESPLTEADPSCHCP